MKIDNLSKAQHPWINQQPPQQNYVMHVDFDCFFAAVSSRGRKDLEGKSCAVTHGGNNSGEIASCNYEARKYGVKNGMWMKEAVKICPDIVSLPYDFDAYEAASDIFYETLLSLDALVVEAVSIDEALVNITNLIPSGLSGSDIETACMELASRIRSTIRERTGVEVSVGIGANVLQAKLAIKKAKPAGHFHLKPENLREVLDSFEVGSIPGVGWSTAKKLEEHFNVTRIEQLLDIGESKLQEVFGPKTGTALADASRGIDSTVVGDIVQRKLVSIEINWGIRLDTAAEVADYMRRVSEELCRKLKSVGFISARHLLVKVMRRSKTAPVEPPKFLGHGPCDKFNAGREIPSSGDASLISKYALALLEGLDIPPEELRGIGVALTKLQAIGSAPQRSVSGYFDALKQGESPINDAPIEKTFNQPKKAVKFAEPKTPVKSRAPFVSGTQFLVPSQLDPEILAELPSPIRAKIHAQRELRESSSKDNQDLYAIPSVSQIDPQDLAALPASVRHEILMNNRAALSNSPSKNRNASISKFVVTTPSPKKVKAIEVKNGPKAPVSRNLTKTFAKIPIHIQAPIISSAPSADIDRNILASLPEDIRREILVADRNKRILEAKKKRKDSQVHVAIDPSISEGKARRTLELPRQEFAPLQGELALETVEGIREYLSDWHDKEPDGPEEEDLTDFSTYIVTLIERERDFERVESLLRWLNLISQRLDENYSWIQAVHQLAQAADEALAKCGLGRLKL